MKTTILTLLAMLAFAGNSILCRLALVDGAIDAGSFTLVRLLSGIIALFALLVFGRLLVSADKPADRSGTTRGSWVGGVSLFVYAAFFSYAYINLSTATGALVLFGTVQISLVLYSFYKGQGLAIWQWLGFAVACLGLAYLLWPELSTPSLLGLLLMIIAGVAWAVYTVKGQGSLAPLADTAHNFLKTTPLLVFLFGFIAAGMLAEPTISSRGLLLAVASGAITSGAGYALWYAALKGLTTTTAAVSQLSVPVFAAGFGLLFAAEPVTERLMLSGLMVLGGILCVILLKPRVR